MKIPEYISVKEVKRVCSELKIRDWTQLKKAEVLIEKAELILAEIETGNLEIRLNFSAWT